MLELAGPDGTPQRHEVGAGERSPTGHTAATLGLGLEEGKAILAAVQRHLVAYERVVAAMGAALPYRRALKLLGEFFPLGSAPAVETTRQQTLVSAPGSSARR